jgi:hypothetical protein
MQRWWMVIATAMVGLAAAALGGAGWFSDEQPPAGAKPLSEIIKMLEDQGMRDITEVEFDGGVWKIEVHNRDGSEVDVRVDPLTGEIRSRK